VHLDVTLKPDAWVDPEKFVKQIADAGYAARRDEIKLTLTGMLLREGERLLFTMSDVKPGPQTFIIVAVASKVEKDEKAIEEAFKEAGDRVGETVEIEGYWRPADTKKDKNALPTLALIRVSASSGAAPATNPRPEASPGL